MFTQRVLLACALGCLLSDAAMYGQDSAPPPPKKPERVKAEVHLAFDKLVAGKRCPILIRLNVQPGWHINSNPPASDDVVKTEILFKSKYGTKLEDLKFPKPHSLTLPDLDDALSVYSGQVDVRGVLIAPADITSKFEEMELVVRYQACNDKTCEFPATIKLNGKLPVAQSGEVAKPINDKLFKTAE